MECGSHALSIGRVNRSRVPWEGIGVGISERPAGTRALSGLRKDILGSGNKDRPKTTLVDAEIEEPAGAAYVERARPYAFRTGAAKGCVRKLRGLGPGRQARPLTPNIPPTFRWADNDAREEKPWT